jgi:hypothetical protein
MCRMRSEPPARLDKVSPSDIRPRRIAQLNGTVVRSQKGKRRRASWSPTFVVDVSPLRFSTDHRSELLRNAGLIEDDNGKRFLKKLSMAAGAYSASRHAVETEKPRNVRSRLRALRKKVASALKLAQDLPMTAEWLFEIDRETYVRRYPDVTLRSVLKDVDNALSAANSWSNARLVDFPRHSLVSEIASALRDAGKKLTGSSRGHLARCTEAVFAALGEPVKPGAGMDRIYRAALKDLRDITTQGTMKR